MKDFVKNLIEQHKFATSQLNKIEAGIKSGNALIGVNDGKYQLMNMLL